MKETKLLFAAIALMNLAFAAGCTQSLPKKKSIETAPKEAEAPPIIGTHYTTIDFEKGKSDLTKDDQEHLRKLTKRAHDSHKKIEEIRILAWADKEYQDAPKTKATPSEIILASERALSVRNFLENDMEETIDIDSFNMARRPDFLSKLLRNDEYEVKKAFEVSGATSSRLPSGETSYTKASKAIVIINYQGDEDNIKQEKNYAQ